jgi:class 3 adenylate cyclase
MEAMAMNEGRQATGATAGDVALLFSDVEGFSEMIDRLGDAEVYLLMRRHDAIFAAALARLGGIEVERQGDGVLLAFDDPTAALHCAIEIQRELAVHSARSPDRPLKVRMGLHYGRPLRERGGYFGRALIVGSRIMGLAHGGEILVSSALRDRATASGEFLFGVEHEVALKGIRQRHRVASVGWRHPLADGVPLLREQARAA